MNIGKAIEGSGFFGILLVASAADSISGIAVAISLVICTALMFIGNTISGRQEELWNLLKHIKGLTRT